MKIRIHRDTLADTVAWVARNLPARPPVPVLAGILIDATDTGLTLSGFDYEVSSHAEVNAEIIAPGKALVSGKLLADITKSLPNKPVELILDGTHVRLVCGSSRFSLPTMPVEDYPTLPTAPEVTGSIPADVFTEAVNQVATAAGKDDTLPMLTGVRVEIDGSQVTLAATDRFRLAVRTLAWDTTMVDSAAVLIPARTLVNTAKSHSATSPVRLALGASDDIAGSGLIGVHDTDRHTTSRLLDAEFPKFRQLLPAEHAQVATVPIAPLVGAIKRMALVAERGAQVRMNFTDGQVTLSAGGDGTGDAEETLDADYAGDPFLIAFNPVYLLDGLGAITAEKVLFGFSTAARPAVLYPAVEVERSESGTFPAPVSEFRYLLMPVRIP